MKRLHLLQPPAAKKEFAEFQINTRWLTDRQFGTTIPLPLVVVIFYFVPRGQGVAGDLRVHEFEHVEQTASLFFLRAWWIYFREWVRAGFSYRKNWLEVQARRAQQDAIDEGLPDWA